MHDKTRRTVCRIAFVMLSVLPTLGVAGFAVYRATPLFAARERQAWEQALENRSGLRAYVGRVSYPRGGVTLLSGVVLVDPDSQQRVIAARLIELARNADSTTVVISQPEVQPGQFLRLWEVFHDRVVRGGSIDKPVQIEAHEATLHESAQALTLSRLACSFESSADTIHAAFDFEVAGAEMATPAHLEMLRRRQPANLSTAWELSTGPASLPCSLFARYFAPLRGLGTDCRFQGMVSAEQSASGWTGHLSGMFDKVNLERMVEPFPHKVRGAGSISIGELTFRDDRISQATGRLDAKDGIISQSLIAEFSRAFALDAASRAAAPGRDLLEYSRLSVGFQLENGGLRILGLCDGDTPGVLLADLQGPLVIETQSAAVPAMALAQALSPDSGLQVPATAETDLLLRSLPLPAKSSDTERTARQPNYAPLRLRIE
jgi:hypothetical protein